MKNKFSNEALLEFLKQTIPKIAIIGCGGAGNNTVQRLYEKISNEEHYEGIEIYAINTDAQHLIKLPDEILKVLIGRKTTRGLGAGADPKKGEEAAKENIEDIKEILQGKDMVFITCGLGGGTGTGSAPVVAQVAREMGILTIAVVTLPFSSEGTKRMNNALEGLNKLKKEVDTIIIIPNDKLIELVPDMPIAQAFKIADNVLSDAIKGITDIITKPGLVQVDFADVKKVLSNGGIAMIGVGESKSDTPETRALECAENAINSPLLDVDISTGERALINIIGGPDLTTTEANTIADAIKTKLKDDAEIILGVTLDDKMPKGQVKAFVVIAGGDITYFKNLSKDMPELNIEELWWYMIVKKIKEYTVNMWRLLKIIKKPKPKEYFHVAKVCGISILIMGALMSTVRLIINLTTIFVKKIFKWWICFI